ncbi:hypothetical protein DAPPUDRAFT_100593 [Daphnia pulex]|uniref:Uncharacterized protein n=1 Tax=Daphnia pulex TaxID=6669 RepID=E9GAU2_DAPPU|nr:hypothetical protein DAPPUDRAFT_100593 [Daphnia pulex]|eukprot:EFX83317.1 hypothetical protein DAPPUDRAFT_100593 [Daphnia pulex]
MLSQLKSYLFGAADGGLMQEPAVGDCANNGGAEDDWVLVDTQEVIGDVASDEETLAGLEESWIVTQDVALKAIVKPSKNNGYGRRHRQPKGTKPRRWKGSSKNNSGGIKPVQASSNEDNESTSSSIAIVPSPEPMTRPAASPVTASTVLAASSDAKQMATIASARIAKQKADKNWMSRKNLLRGNQTMMAAAGRNNRRSQLIGSRLCGSNNNRKSHQF